MQLESLLCKEKWLRQSYGEMLPSSLAPSSSQMIRQTVEMRAVVRWVSLLQFVLGRKNTDIIHWFVLAKDKGGHTHFCLFPQDGWLAYVWKYHWGWSIYLDCTVAFADMKITYFPGKFVTIRVRNCYASFCTYIDSMVHRHSVNVLDWPVCIPDLFPLLPWTVEAAILNRERLGKKSTWKTAAINLLSSEMIKCLIKWKCDVRLELLRKSQGSCNWKMLKYPCI